MTKVRIDMQSSNKRFNEIINEVKKQGGSVSSFIIESVIFRENHLKMNRGEISPNLDVNKYSEYVPIQQFVAPYPNVVSGASVSAQEEVANYSKHISNIIDEDTNELEEAIDSSHLIPDEEDEDGLEDAIDSSSLIPDDDEDDDC